MHLDFKRNQLVVGEMRRLWLTTIVIRARRSLPSQFTAHGSLVFGQRGWWTGFCIGVCVRTERILAPSEAGASVTVIDRRRCRPAGAQGTVGSSFAGKWLKMEIGLESKD